MGDSPPPVERRLARGRRAVTLFFIAHRYGPWIQFKADCITAPIALLLAFAGVGGLGQAFRARRGGRAGRLRLATAARVVGLLAGAVIVAAVLAGNALTYHDTSLAPYARLRDLQQIGERFAGQGPTLTPDFDQYAEYYLRDDDQDSMVNGPALSLRPGVNRETEPGGIFAYDLDEYPLPFVEGFRTIVMRRNPLASRPPSNYRLVYSSPYYLVWQRSAPASSVVAHLHFADQPADTKQSLCREATVAARKAGPRASIAYTLPPHGYLQVDGSNMITTRYLPGGSGTIFAPGPGRAVREQPVPHAGRYELFFNGSFGRPVDVYVDGRHVATAAYQESYPDQWDLEGTVYLSRGVHRIEFRRGGTSAHPGNGNGLDAFSRTIGPLVIYPSGTSIQPVRDAPLAALPQLCNSSRRLRWLEIVRPA